MAGQITAGNVAASHYHPAMLARQDTPYTLLKKNLLRQFFLCLLLFLWHSCASAANIVIVQSGAILPYKEATEGINSILQRPTPNASGPKNLGVHVETVVLNTTLDNSSWQRKIEKLRPSAIIAVGTRALRIAAQTDKIPLVYLITPRPDKIIGKRAQTTGVPMVVPPRASLQKLHTHFPRIKRLTVLYHPEYSSGFMEKARQAADLYRYTLRAIEVESLQEVPRVLSSLGPETEALWMIPDPNVVSSETTPAFLDCSFRNNIVLISFAEKYVEMGAALAIVPDSYRMGRHAGRMALSFLDKRTVPETKPAPSMAFQLMKNKQVLSRMASSKHSSRQ